MLRRKGEECKASGHFSACNVALRVTRSLGSLARQDMEEVAMKRRSLLLVTLSCRVGDEAAYEEEGSLRIGSIT